MSVKSCGHLRARPAERQGPTASLVQQAPQSRSIRLVFIGESRATIHKEFVSERYLRRRRSWIDVLPVHCRIPTLMARLRLIRFYAPALLDGPMLCPGAPLIPHVGACTFRRRLDFFIREATLAQEPRERGMGQPPPLAPARDERPVRAW